MATITNTAPAYAKVMEDLGGDIAAIDSRFVHGSMYRRLVPLVGARFDRGAVPPNALLWLITRVHPAFRRRERRAAETLATDRFADEVDAWQSERKELLETNLALSAIAVEHLDKLAIADHIGVLDRHLVAGWVRHHQLHGSDLGPIGDLLVHTNDWNIDPVEVMELLQGASSAITDAARHGRAIATALRSAGIDPEGINDVAEIRSEPTALTRLDNYLSEFGWRMVTSYDLEGRTLHELPRAICSLVRAAGAELVDDSESVEIGMGGGAGVPHDQVALSPEQQVRAIEMAETCSDPELFHQLLGRARRAYGLRDDNGPMTWEWPISLMRRAYLAAAIVLETTKQISKLDHVFEMDADGVQAMLRGDCDLCDRDLEQRASVRQWEADQDGPDFFGPPPTKPDLSALPPALARVMAIMVAATTMLEPDTDREAIDLVGLGIGKRRYEGRALVAADADKVIEAMEPGEVLVVAWTAPSFNAVLSIAGAVVVQEGGLLCHSAVMARELDIPAVVGCFNAMSLIQTGDLIEVDPVAGTVRVLDADSGTGQLKW